MLTFIRYIELYFAVVFLDYVRYNKDFVKSRFIVPKSCSILILLYIILARLKKIVRYTEDFRYIECAEPNTYFGWPKLLSSTVDSDGLTLHVPNLIRGEEKYYPFCSK